MSQIKAKELVGKYESIILKKDYGVSGFIIKQMAKACALICVEEIINEVSNTIVHAGRGGLTDTQYWIAVKKEIKNNQ